MKKRIISAHQTFSHFRNRFLPLSRQLLYIYNKVKGQKKSICRLRLTVGCCEKIMAKSTMPTNPQTSRIVASNHRKRVFRLPSIAVSTRISIATISIHTLGERGPPIPSGSPISPSTLFCDGEEPAQSPVSSSPARTVAAHRR